MLRPLLRRVLSVVGVAGTFVLLFLVGSSVAALFSPGDAARTDPEPVRPATPSPPPQRARVPDPPPPAQPPPPPTPPPAPVLAEPRPPLADAGTMPLPERLRVRRELIRSVTGLKGELARCPSTRAHPLPGGRAALVLELEGVGDGARVLGTTLEADMPVNDAFVACARALFQGKTLTAAGVSPGIRLHYFIPLGPAGSSLSLSSSSVIDGEDVAPR